MLNSTTKNRINSCRDILVGKIPDPKGQIDQITNALVYKFMDDQDRMSRELGYDASFFIGDYEQYAWSRFFDAKLTNQDKANLYSEGLDKLSRAKHLPDLFKEIFKDAYLPFRDANTIVMFLNEINGFDYHHSEELGNAFEYLLSIMGSQGDAGQFRTPRHIIEFLVDVVDPQKSETILDPACGTAGFLVEAFKHITAKGDLGVQDVAKLAESITGVDIDPGMAKIARVNLYLHGFKTPKITENDTLTNEKLWGTKYDVILANPPFMTPKGGIQPHDKFAIRANRAEVLFTDYIAEHLRLHGRAGIIVPEGIIFQGSNAYKDLRKMLVDDRYLWAVVSLPSGVFNPYAGVKTSILFLDRERAKNNDSILFVKISADGYDLGAQRRPIEKNDLPKALEILNEYKENPAINLENEPLAHLVEKSRIAESGEYNLSGERYRESTVSQDSKFEMVPLGEVCELFDDGDWIESKDQSETGIRLIQTGNIGVGVFKDKGDRARYIGEDTFHRLDCTEIFPGDLLISRLPDPVGRSCILPNISERMITAVDCTIIRPNKNLALSQYLLYCTNSEKYFEQIYLLETGASRKRISKGNLKTIQIPLPPIEIQEQIVAELDGYQRIIDGARAVVENYKPTIKIDPAWEIVDFETLCDIVRGSSPRPAGDSRYYGPGVPRLMVGDITRDGMYTVPKIDSLTLEGAKLSRPMKKGDLIMAVSGQPGVCCILGVDACIHDGFAGFRNLDNTRVITEFAYFALMSMQEKHNNESTGAIFKNLNTDQIRKFRIPLPPLEIQQSIVERIQEEQSLIEANRRLIEIYEGKIREKMDEVWGITK